MKRHGFLAMALLTIGFSAAAQNSPSAQADASAQAQTSTSASASTGSSQQNQNSAAQKESSKRASASASNGSSASTSAGANSLNLAGGTAVPATLVTPLDAKHSKPGDPVVAKTTQDVKQNGQVVLKKGSELKGHVTQAEARSGQNAESTLGVVFDSAVPKGSHEPMPANFSIQALAAAQNQAETSIGEDQAALGSAGQAGFTGSGATAPVGAPAPAGGGLTRGVGGTVGGVTNTAGGVTRNVAPAATGTVGTTTRTVGSAGSTGGLNAAGQLTSNSSGVFNLQGMNLTSAASNGTQASVLNSATQNVHLESGTQMVLQVVRQ
jgi:pilus assembly protein FimV